jgi:hypothetical protein
MDPVYIDEEIYYSYDDERFANPYILESLKYEYLMMEYFEIIKGKS